jgi:hypothetical protein
MNNEEEIHTAWTIWNLMAKLNKLIWDRYETEFTNRYIKLQQSKSSETQAEKNLLSNPE